MPPDARPAELVASPFSRRRAAELGVMPGALRGPGWQPVFRGVHAASELPLTREVWLSAARVFLAADAVLCGISAAEAYGVDVRRRRDDVTVHVTMDRRPAAAQRNLRVREQHLQPHDLVLRDGWLVTTPLRTAFDCGCWLSLVEGLSWLTRCWQPAW